VHETAEAVKTVGNATEAQENPANVSGGSLVGEQPFAAANSLSLSPGRVAMSANESLIERLVVKVQKLTVLALAAMLVVVMLLSTVHLGALISEEVWKPPRWLIPVQGLLEIFGYFLLVLIGVELLETLKAYLKKDVIHVRVVLEVALIAMARKVIIEEPNTAPGLTLFGIAALILALGIAFYFERQAKREPAAG
jgi:uncharacterized membrane protein (DUF373 family)